MSWKATALFEIAGTAFTIGDALALGSALTSVAGATGSARADAQAAEYNAALARNEARAEENRVRRLAGRELGQIRAGIAKSGVTTEGSPLLALAESAELAELDALNVRYSGESSASLYEQRAKSSRRSIPYSVGTGILKGVSAIGRSRVRTETAES